MECKLGLALGCTGMRESGDCSVYSDEGVAWRMNVGFCAFKNIRASSTGIYAPKTGKMRNPLKAAKAAERGKAVEA